jgi:hypothetical protein
MRCENDSPPAILCTGDKVDCVSKEKSASFSVAALELVAKVELMVTPSAVPQYQIENAAMRHDSGRMRGTSFPFQKKTSQEFSTCLGPALVAM